MNRNIEDENTDDENNDDKNNDDNLIKADESKNDKLITVSRKNRKR